MPVTVLSRCQRFDLRRIDSAELAAYLTTLAEKEKVKIEEGALALIARAAEGSARDSLSLLDQAIAHRGGSGGEGEMITADTVRQMLGLADRGRVLDIFEKLMAGKVSEALTDLSGLYDAGADPFRKNGNGSSPMSLATQNTGRGGSGTPEAKAQQRDIVQLLEQRGATL